MPRRPDLDRPTRGVISPELEISGVKTRLMAEQLTVVDPETRLGGFAGRLSRSELDALDDALEVVLGLD
ncbi:MAG TPA: type II toxin-antitoxin system PemK/MazF family toxin [Actinomycetales bacterium]|nr:type II toxin-antitoxin system PemK/MazF family toxin [Actinomycetales bacterium]